MNIAICDDEVRAREGIERVIKAAFSEAVIRGFSSGQELLEAFTQDFTPDIVLLDIAMEEKKLIEVIERAAAELEKTNSRKRNMLIKVSGGFRKLNIDDILYAESNGRKVILHTKQEKLEFYEKMDELEQRLGCGFYRCHRSYLVSLAEVRGYDSTSISLSNGEVIYLAKRKYAEFVQTYCRFLQETV